MADVPTKPTRGKVLVIYTGGTIGSRPRDEGDPDSPQVVVDWDDLSDATPELGRIEARGLQVKCHELAKLDSCNIGPIEWRAMGEVIAKNYELFDGFVILHGTDTMVYTASALSFMLENLGKPVILTGAQRSAMVDVRNDSGQNFITSLLIASPRFSNLPVVPEVCIFFGNKLIRGNRAFKNTSSGYGAYESANINLLGTAGERITIDTSLIRPVPGPDRRFRLKKDMEPRITTIFIYPGMQDTDLVKRQLEMPGLKGAIIHAYGSGNIPTNEKVLQPMREARAKGMLLAIVTQCRHGPVELGIYETSAELLELGCTAANDITPEAARCKLMTLLADPDSDVDQASIEFQRSIAGEQSHSVYVTLFPKAADKEIAATSEPANYRVPAEQLAGPTWEAERIDKAFLRLRRARLSSPDKEKPANVSVFVDLPAGEVPDEHFPGFVRRFNKEPTEKEALFLFDVTDQVRAVGVPGKRKSFTLVVNTPGASLSWKAIELALHVRE